MQSSRFFYVDAESGIYLSAFQSANAFLRPRFHTTPELPEADSVQAIQRRIPEFRLHPRCLGYSFFLRSHGPPFIASVGA